MSTQQDKLLERQARVYEVLDVATKPAQLFIGGAKLLLFVLVLILLAVGYPIYEVVNGQPVAASNITRAVLCLSGLVLFFLAPYYVVLGGTAALVWFGYWVNQHTEAELAAVPVQLWMSYFIGFGYAQYFLRRFFRKGRNQRHSSGKVIARHVDVHNSPNLDAPVPDDLLQDLNQMVHSVADDLEAAVEHDLEDFDARDAEFDRRMSEIEAMPTDDALKSTSAMLAESSSRMQELHGRMMSGDFSTQHEAGHNVQQLLQLQKQVDYALSSLIDRLKRESAPYPVQEFEQVLAECKVTTAQIERRAAAKGLL